MLDVTAASDRWLLSRNKDLGLRLYVETDDGEAQGWAADLLPGGSSGAAGSREGCSPLPGPWRPGLSQPCAWGDAWGDDPCPAVGVSGVQGPGSRSRGPLPQCSPSSPCAEPTLELLRESLCFPSPGATL